MQAAAESQGTASAISTNLHEIGYDSATPKRAEAAVTNNPSSQPTHSTHPLNIHSHPPRTIFSTRPLHHSSTLQQLTYLQFNPRLLQHSPPTYLAPPTSLTLTTHVPCRVPCRPLHDPTHQVSDVEIATLSVITFNQCIDGVSVEDAESDAFQATLVAAVGSQIQSGNGNDDTLYQHGHNLSLWTHSVVNVISYHHPPPTPPPFLSFLIIRPFIYFPLNLSIPPLLPSSFSLLSSSIVFQTRKKSTR